MLNYQRVRWFSMILCTASQKSHGKWLTGKSTAKGLSCWPILAPNSWGFSVSMFPTSISGRRTKKYPDMEMIGWCLVDAFSCFFHIIWVNYNISLTWIKAIWGWFPLLTMIPVRSQWGRYNLPRSDIIAISEGIGEQCESITALQRVDMAEWAHPVHVVPVDTPAMQANTLWTQAKQPAICKMYSLENHWVWFLGNKTLKIANVAAKCVAASRLLLCPFFPATHGSFTATFAL